MTECCGYGKCTGVPGCVTRSYSPRQPKRETKTPLSQDGFGWFLIIVMSVLVVAPMSVIAKPFGDDVGPIVFILLVIGFPASLIYIGTHP